jgi:hypothetical protein
VASTLLNREELPVLEIFVDPRRTSNLKQAILDAIENGEYEGLSDDIRDCFTDEQIDQMEEVIESGDIEEAIDEIISEWSGDSLDELIEMIEAQFVEWGVEVHFEDDDLDVAEDEVAAIDGFEGDTVAEADGDFEEEDEEDEDDDDEEVNEEDEEEEEPEEEDY